MLTLSLNLITEQSYYHHPQFVGEVSEAESDYVTFSPS